MHIKTLSAILAGLLLAGGSMAASAQTITIGQDSVTSASGGSANIAISYDDNGNTNIGAYNTVVDYSTLTTPTNYLGGVPTAVYNGGSGFGTCVVDDPSKTISITRANSASLPDETVCTVTFQVNAGTPVAAYALAHDPAPASTAFFDLTATNVAGTVVDGAINVIAAPPDVVVTFSPNHGTTIAFPGGTVATNQTANISVSNTGTVGTGTVSGCAFGGANAAAFSIISGVPATVPPNATIALQATLAATPLAATLTCVVTDAAAGSPNNRTWNLTAPAGTPVPSPAYSSSPAPGSTIALVGVPASTLTSSVVITNSGDPGAGSDLTYSCSVTGPDFSITSGAGGTLVVGASGTVALSVIAPADGVTVTDQMVCTSNGRNGSTFTYELSATGQARVAPTYVPASSLWSKLALFGIFAALGMLIIGLRRSH